MLLCDLNHSKEGGIPNMINRIKFPQENKEGVIAFVFVKPPAEDLYFVVKQIKSNSPVNRIVIETPFGQFDWGDSADYVEALMIARNLAMTKDMNNRFQHHMSLEDAIRGGYFMNSAYNVFYDYVDSKDNQVYYYRLSMNYALLNNPLGSAGQMASHFPNQNGFAYPGQQIYPPQPPQQSSSLYGGAQMGMSIGYGATPQSYIPPVPQVRQIPVIVEDVFTLQKEELMVDITLPVVLRVA